MSSLTFGSRTNNVPVRLKDFETEQAIMIGRLVLRRDA
jgi:hypothetical protein